MNLKPENLLFDSQYNLLISNFGHSRKNPSNQQKRYPVGTKGYQAPEIVTGRGTYNGYQADIFSLGVILFFMVSYEFPFQEAKNSDPEFKDLVNNKERFWRSQAKKIEGGELFFNA